MASVDDLVSLTLHRENEDQKLGISLKKERNAVFVTAIDRDGMFHGSNVAVNDKILSVNGHKIGKEESIEDYMKMIEDEMDKLTLVVKKANKSASRGARSRSPMRGDGKGKKMFHKETKLNADGSFNPNFNPNAAAFGAATADEDDKPQLAIRATKDDAGQDIGLSFKKIGEMLFINGIKEDSPYRDTDLYLGDRIAAVNGTNFLSYADATYALKLLNKKQETSLHVEKGHSQFKFPADVDIEFHWDKSPKAPGFFSVPEPETELEPEPEPEPEGDAETEPEPAPAPAPSPADDGETKLWWQEGYE